MDTTTLLSLAIIAVSVVVIGLVLYRGSRRTRRVVADQAAREDAVERMSVSPGPAGPAVPPDAPPAVPVAPVAAPVPAAAQGSAAQAGAAAGEIEMPLEVEVTNLKRGEAGPKGS